MVKCFFLLTILSSILLSMPTTSYGATYGEVLNAYGNIVGHMMALVVRREVCSEKFPAMKTGFDEAFDGLTQRNCVFEKVRDAVFLQARQEGGEAEAQRVSREMSPVIYEVINSERANVQRSISKSDCLDIAAAVRQGVFDLNIRKRKELDTIFGVR